MKTVFRYLGLSAAVLICTLMLWACSSPSSFAAAADKLTQGKFDAFLKASSLYTALVDTQDQQGTDIGDIQTKQTADEALLALVALIGHSPSSGISRRSMAFHPGETGAVTAAVDFGDCTNMGTLIGFSSPNPAGAQVAFFKTCKGYWYGVYADDVGTHHKGDIFEHSTIWYTDSDCGQSGGTVIMLSEGGVNKLAGEAGYGFTSPNGGTAFTIAQGSEPASMTSGSAFVANSGCVVDVETQPGYTLVPTAVTTSGIPAVAPADFTL